MRCKRCEVEKDLSQFQASELRPSRGSQWCRPCVTEYKRGWKEKRRRAAGVPVKVIKYSSMEVSLGVWHCRKCEADKPEAEFPPSAIKPSSRGWCRSCVTDHVRRGNAGYGVWKSANERYVSNGKSKIAHTAWRHSDDGRLRLSGYAGRRRAKIRAATAIPLPRGFEKSLLQKQKFLCAACRCKLFKFHKDHIMPLALGGTHEPNNIQLLCPPCNIKKSDKHPVAFMQEIGALL